MITAALGPEDLWSTHHPDALSMTETIKWVLFTACILAAIDDPEKREKITEFSPPIHRL